jgi:hypothetical protein
MVSRGNPVPGGQRQGIRETPPGEWVYVFMGTTRLIMLGTDLALIDTALNILRSTVCPLA